MTKIHTWIHGEFLLNKHGISIGIAVLKKIKALYNKNYCISNTEIQKNLSFW